MTAVHEPVYSLTVTAALAAWQHCFSSSNRTSYIDAGSYIVRTLSYIRWSDTELTQFDSAWLRFGFDRTFVTDSRTKVSAVCRSHPAAIPASHAHSIH